MINNLFQRTWFPLVFQLLTLVVFILLIAGGLPANTGDMAFAKVLRNTNVANLIVWSYWWPLIILSAIFLGRRLIAQWLPEEGWRSLPLYLIPGLYGGAFSFADP